MKFIELSTVLWLIAFVLYIALGAEYFKIVKQGLASSLYPEKALNALAKLLMLSQFAVLGMLIAWFLK
jgi:hypothetical protein